MDVRTHVNAYTASFSLHLLLVGLLVWFSAAAVRHASRASAAPRNAAAVTASFELLLVPSLEALTPSVKHMEERLALPHESGSTELDLPNFTYDFRKISERATTLFPFLTHDVVLSTIRSIAVESAKGGLPNPYARPPGSSKPPLRMSEQGIQALVDKTWSRRERWSVFQPVAALVERYNPTEGMLPVVVRRYAEQNLLQPYVETAIRDPRLWTMLGISADHSDFIEYVSTYAAAYPSSRVTTELLFILDEMAQGSRDTLLTLLDVRPETELWWTHHANGDAAATLEVLRAHYRRKLEREGIATTEGVRLRYDNVRLSILQAITAATPRGYRADDARYLIGEIYWKNGRAEDAVRWWRAMTVDPTNGYSTASAGIVAAVAGTDWQNVDPVAIKRVMDKESYRWSDFWWTRLRSFGYSFDTY